MESERKREREREGERERERERERESTRPLLARTQKWTRAPARACGGGGGGGLEVGGGAGGVELVELGVDAGDDVLRGVEQLRREVGGGDGE